MSDKNELSSRLDIPGTNQFTWHDLFLLLTAYDSFDEVEHACPRGHDFFFLVAKAAEMALEENDECEGLKYRIAQAQNMLSYTILQNYEAISKLHIAVDGVLRGVFTESSIRSGTHGIDQWIKRKQEEDTERRTELEKVTSENKKLRKQLTDICIVLMQERVPGWMTHSERYEKIREILEGEEDVQKP